jgi:hypothetical protein
MNESALAELSGTQIEYAPYRRRDNALRRLHQQVGGAYHEMPPAVADEGVASLRSPRPAALELPRRALSLLSPLYGDFPDEFRGWVDPAVEAGVALVAKHGVDAVYSVCPPAPAHVIGSRIARRTGVPWVAQFDDLFSFHLERQQRAAWRAFADRAHRAWMRRATFAAAITPSMLDYVARTYDLDGEVVMVGFDPDEGVAADPPPGHQLRLAYTGSVYLNDHRPELFFEARDIVLRARDATDRRIEVTFAGTRHDAELRRILERFPNAARACVFVERLSPSETLRLQRQAHGLVLFNYTTPTASHGTLSFPAKAFEYLNARRPILAMPGDPGGWGNALLSSTRAGVTANTADEGARVIEGWLSTWRETGSVPYGGDANEIARYGQPRQAATLGTLLDRAVSAHH